MTRRHDLVRDRVPETELGRELGQELDPDLREVDVALRLLRVPAPPSLLPSTLVAVGLADGYAPFDSPLGRVYVAFNARGISAVMLADGEAKFESRFLGEQGRPARRVDALPPRLERAVERRLGGDRQAAVTVDLRGGTPFEQAVWRKTAEIPRGEVRPYGWVASEIGHPRAVRAVGSALGRNPVPLVIPCHRVVRSDGLIGNYGLGGSQAKGTVLASEGVDLERLEALARAGVRYLGSDTTRIFCLPTCHNARRIQPIHRVEFHSGPEATRAGYRACRECRPAAVHAA